VSSPSFKTAKQILAEQAARPSLTSSRSAEVTELELASESTVLVVAPELTIEKAKQLWNAILDFRDLILSDPTCFDVIAGGKEMNRTGATRLATAFGLSIEDRGIEEGGIQAADSGEWDYRFRVRIRVSKGARFVDGIGSCRISEITTENATVGAREHFALTKAWTRAAKRAIADILGGTEAD
jgi:hypothetical protein